MILAFHTRKLRELCESQTKAETQLGIDPASQLRARLADLSSVDKLFDLIVGSPTEVQPGIVKIDIGRTHVMTIEANHRKVPKTSDAVDWVRVSRIKVLAIEARK